MENNFKKHILVALLITTISTPSFGQSSGELKEFSGEFLSTLQTNKCIAKTLVVPESQFKSKMVDMRNKINTIKDKKNKAIFDVKYYDSKYAEYNMNILQFYQSLLDTGLTGPIGLLAKDGSKALKGFMTSAVRDAAGLALTIPGYTVERRSDKAGFQGQLLSSLPPETLNKLNQCVSEVKFTNPDLSSFKEELLKDIKDFQKINEESADVKNKVMKTPAKPSTLAKAKQIIKTQIIPAGKEVVGAAIITAKSMTKKSITEKKLNVNK